MIQSRGVNSPVYVAGLKALAEIDCVASLRAIYYASLAQRFKLALGRVNDMSSVCSMIPSTLRYAL